MLTRSGLTLLGSALCVLLLWPCPQARAAGRDRGRDDGRTLVYDRQFTQRQFIPGRVGEGYRHKESTILPADVGPHSAWHGRGRYHRYSYRPYRQYDRRYPRYYAQPFGHPGYYPTFSPYYDRNGRSYDDYFEAYRKAEQYKELKQLVRRRESRLGRQHLQLMNEGLAAFHRGDYRLAANQFMAAAESNHGDAGSRLHAAHALIAVGDYRSAVVLLRRAFQLQPKIVALEYDIRDDYRDIEDFRLHLRRLHEEAIRAERDEDLWILLGYVRFYSGDRVGAYDDFRLALKFSPRDPLAAQLAKASMTADAMADR